MLTYTVADAIMKLSKDAQNKLNNKFLNIITGYAKSQGALTNKTTTDILKNTVNNTFDYYSYNADINDFEKIINNHYKGQHFSSRVWKNEQEVAVNLHGQVQDFLQGKVNLNQIKNNIKEAYDNNAYEVKRLVETEVSRCQNEAFDRFCTS
jgi:predicted RNA-binding Zn ribbon-like protein